MPEVKKEFKTIQEIANSQDFWVHCNGCNHEWVAMHTPIEIGKAVQIIKRVICPKCAALSDKISCGKKEVK